MDLSMLIIGAGLLAGSFLLSGTVEFIMRRTGIHPVHPDERARGIREVFDRLSQWRKRAEASRDSRK